MDLGSLPSALLLGFPLGTVRKRPMPPAAVLRFGFPLVPGGPGSLAVREIGVVAPNVCSSTGKCLGVFSFLLVSFRFIIGSRDRAGHTVPPSVEKARLGTSFVFGDLLDLYQRLRGSL